jgi:hypothetical protein
MHVLLAKLPGAVRIEQEPLGVFATTHFSSALTTPKISKRDLARANSLDAISQIGHAAFTPSPSVAVAAGQSPTPSANHLRCFHVFLFDVIVCVLILPFVFR